MDLNLIKSLLKIAFAQNRCKHANIADLSNHDANLEETDAYSINMDITLEG